MDLTVSKRFEFSASHRLWVENWSPEKNLALYGDESRGAYGHGHNFVAWFVFRGDIDERNGMIINVTTIKEKIGKILQERYDHKYLNEDTAPFNRIVPTPEVLARNLLEEAIEVFKGGSARPVACHLEDSPTSGATAYDDDSTERHFTIDFSAARRTWSPLLSERDNEKMFGIASAPAGHGHHYRLRVTMGGAIDNATGMIVPEGEVLPVLREFKARYDHRNLSADFP